MTITRMSKNDRTQQIIASAFEVFIEKGYRASTTLDIAKAAHISEVTLFRYFSSKHELFMAGVQPVIDEALTIMSNPDGLSLSSEDLTRLILNKVNFLSKHKGMIKLILNEQSLNQLGENIVEKMVHNLSEAMIGYGFKAYHPYYVRLLMGHFLSFLYAPSLEDNQIRDFTERLVLILLER